MYGRKTSTGTRLENGVKYPDKTLSTKILVPEKRTMKSCVFEVEITYFFRQKLSLDC